MAHDPYFIRFSIALIPRTLMLTSNSRLIYSATSVDCCIQPFNLFVAHFYRRLGFIYYLPFQFT